MTVMLAKAYTWATTIRSGDRHRRQYKTLLPLAICFAFPATLLVGAYVQMALRYEKLWLFDTIVHERGKYTLLQVIFYFRHFLWEAPIKVLYSLFAVGAFFYFGKPVAAGNKSEAPVIEAKRILVSFLVVLGILLVSILMTARDYGFREAMAGLLQYRTHELRPLDFGSHWRNHFLSNIVLFSTSAVFALVYRLINSGGYWARGKSSVLLPLSSVTFILLTLFFGLTMDPFETPSYLGHQLREIFGSDLPITMFLAMGVLILLEKKYDIREIAINKKPRKNRKKTFTSILIWSVPIVLITGFLITKVLRLNISGEIASLGSTKGWSILDLFAWHFFEHSIDYIFVLSLVYFIYLFTLKIEFKKRP